MKSLTCLAIAVLVLACRASEPPAQASALATAAPAAAAAPVAPAASSAAPAEVACKAACAHRAECIAGASNQTACLADCTALAMVIGEQGVASLEAYTAADCAAAQREEPGFQQAAGCLRACKHVLECGVAGTFPGCLTECAQNLQGGVYSLDQVAAITTADCNTVKQNVRLSSAPADPALCTATCRNFDRCGQQSFAACMKECPGIEPSRLQMFANATCEQLRTGDYGSQGFGCSREGKQDCPPTMMCCRHHRATVRGESGQCLYAAICYGI